MRNRVVFLGLAFLAATIAFSGAWAAYQVQYSSPRASVAQLADTRVEVRPLGRGPTTIRVLVRPGTVRLERDSLARGTLQTPVPAVLLLSPEVTWLRIMTDPESHAVEVLIAGPPLKRHERAPWGRVVTLRKVDDRWQSEVMFLRADSIPFTR